jgi:hypothetical protein
MGANTAHYLMSLGTGFDSVWQMSKLYDRAMNS